jgi:hypothetical protein
MPTMTARHRLPLVVATLVLVVVLALALVAAALAAVPVAIALATGVFALVVGLRARGPGWARSRRSRQVRWSAVDLPPAVDGPSWMTTWDTPPTPSDLSATRGKATAVLAEWDVHGEAAEPTLLVLTELLSNAIEHARPPLRVTLGLGGNYVRVEVHDTAAHPPRCRPREDEGRGHGVQIVAALAMRHGWTPDPLGKTVWADVPVGWPD